MLKATAFLLACIVLAALEGKVRAQSTCSKVNTYSTELIPVCSSSLLYVKLPVYTNFHQYYECTGGTTVILQTCSGNLWFSYVQQICTTCADFAPAPPCDQLKTQSASNCVAIGSVTSSTSSTSSTGSIIVTPSPNFPTPLYPEDTTTTSTTTKRTTAVEDDTTTTTKKTPITTEPSEIPTPPEETSSTSSGGIPQPPSEATADPNVPTPPTPAPTPPSLTVPTEIPTAAVG